MKIREMIDKVDAALTPIAQRLGLRVDVIVDGDTDGFRIRAWVPRIWDVVVLDYDLFFTCPEKQVAPLLEYELEALQLRLFDTIRERLDALDVRGRIVQLSNADKETMHDLFMDACVEASRHPDHKERITKYQTLIDRFYR